MSMEKLLNAFDNGNPNEKYQAAFAIALRLEDGSCAEYAGEALSRSDWLVYALVYAPDDCATKRVSSLLACA